MAIALVARTAKGSSDGNNVASDAINTTGANFLAIFTSGSGNAHNTPTDSVGGGAGNTWTSLTAEAVGGGEEGIWYWSAPSNVGASHVFNWSGTANLPSIVVYAFSGVDTGTAPAENAGGSDFGTTVQPGSITPAVANALILQGVSFNTAATFSINESYNFAGTSADYIDKAVNNMGVGAAYLIQGGAAATNPTWTASGNTSMVAVGFVMRPSGGGGGGSNIAAIQASYRRRRA